MSEVYDPESGELISLGTGQVVGQYAEPASHKSDFLKRMRHSRKAGVAPSLNLGTVLTPTQQMRLNKRLGLHAFQTLPPSFKIRRSRGLAQPTEVLLNPTELEVLKETIAEDLPEVVVFEEKEKEPPKPQRRIASPAWFEQRRKRLLESLGGAVQRAEEGASQV